MIQKYNPYNYSEIPKMNSFKIFAVILSDIIKYPRFIFKGLLAVMNICLFPKEPCVSKTNG